nr:nicotinamide-nucleotide adenylyltransferase [Nitrosopumilus sp. K4]
MEKILDECDEVIIAVTSSQFNYLEKDPFTAGERIEMIHNSINDSQIDLSRCFIVGIENQFNVATWSAYLRSALPHFDKVYSGNDYVKMLLADSGIDVVTPKFLDRATYNATKIRKMMISGENWESFVPKAVVDYIKNINGENRLKVISQSDTKPTEH